MDNNIKILQGQKDFSLLDYAEQENIEVVNHVSGNSVYPKTTSLV